jgi:hypothetical protein
MPKNRPSVSRLPFDSAPEIEIRLRHCILAIHSRQRLSLFFTQSAISAFAFFFLGCLFLRFACFLQQPSHPILVPQPENCQSHEFWWAIPDASVDTLTRYSEPLGKFHLGQAKLLADPIKLSPIHFYNAKALKPACPGVLHAQLDTNLLPTKLAVFWQWIVVPNWSEDFCYFEAIVPSSAGRPSLLAAVAT